MGLNQVNLQNYDMVVAVTQNAVNEGLAEYLMALQKNVALYYNSDSSGNLIPATDPATATFTFTGTLGYTLDANSNPVNVVTLNTNGKGVQSVFYNITFTNATFKSTAPPPYGFNAVQVPGSPWIIRFVVNLAQATVPVDSSSLPADVQKAVANLTSSLGAGMFSLQQLYLDLNTAVFDSFQNITGMPQLAGALLETIMGDYLVSLQTTGGVIFGYSLTAASGTASTPTFMPTAFEFCVSPYIGTLPTCAPQLQPGALDTLNYLLMINNNPPPTSPPAPFAFNWVDDCINQGGMAVRHDHYVQFLANQLSSILQVMCPICYVKASNSENLSNQTLDLNQGSSNSFSVTGITNNGVIAQCAYTSPEANNTDNGFGGSTSAQLDYSMTCTVSASGDTITLAGYPCVSATTSSTDSLGNVSQLIMPPTTFSWSVDLVLQMNLSNNGQLTYSIQNQNYNSPPTVAPESQSAWDKFWSAVGGVFSQFATDPSNIVASIQTNVTSAIQPALQNAINTANDFVFPGGNTFIFANPQVSLTNDLVSNITYLSSNG